MGDCTIPSTGTFSKDVEIVAMEMHGMCGWDCILQDDTHRIVGAEVIDIPLRIVWVGCIAEVRQKQEWIVVISAE